MLYRIHLLNTTDTYIDFTKDTPIETKAYNVLDNEYTFDAFTVNIPYNENIDWLTQLRAENVVEIVDMHIPEVGDDTYTITIKHTLVHIGDLLVIDNEVFRVESITNNSPAGGYDRLTITRVHPLLYTAGHFASEEYNKYGLVNGFNSPIGTVGVLMYYDDLSDDFRYLHKVYITDVQSNGDNYSIHFNNLLNLYSRDIEVGYNPRREDLAYYLERVFRNVINFDETFGSPDYFSLNPSLGVLLYLNINKEKMLNKNNTRTLLFNPMDLLKNVLYLNNYYLTPDLVNNDGKYILRKIDGFSSFDTAEIKSLYDFISLSSGYTSEIRPIGRNIKLKFQAGVDVHIPGVGLNLRDVEHYFTLASITGSFAGLEDVEITFDNVYVNAFDVEEVYKTIKQSVAEKQLILGHLTVGIQACHNAHNKPKIGTYYSLNELNDENLRQDLITFIDYNPSIEYIALCYSVSIDEARFVIMEKKPFNFIAPAVFGTIRNSGDSILIDRTHLKEALQTTSDNISGAKHTLYNYDFFKAGMKIIVLTYSSLKVIASTTVNSVVNNKIYFSDTMPLSNGDEVIVTYDETTTDALQNVHLRNTVGII